MAEAFERQREQNLLAAWNSGGTFEGKKATDGMVLSFWKKRMQEVSKDDPLYEYYKNLHTQYTFSIAESKMTLAYAQKRISEAGVAAFYRRWASKVPRRSEIYRELMRNAARFANAAGSGGGGGGGGSSNKAAIYARRDRALYNQYEAPGVFLENQLTAWMRSARYLTGAPGTVGRPNDRGETLDDMSVDLSINPDAGPGEVTENDPQALMLLIEAAGQDPEWAAYINRSMKELDPSWSGRVEFDRRYFIRSQRRRRQGLRKRIQLAKRFGVSESDIARLKEQDQHIKRQIVQYRLLDEHELYTEARADVDAVFNDPESSFSDLVNAHFEYIDDLGNISDKVKKTPNYEESNMAAALDGEIAMLTGRELLAEGRTVGEGGGLISADGLTASEETINAASTAGNFVDLLEKVESGQYGIIETPNGQGSVFGERDWAVVDLSNPPQALGNDYATLPRKMDSYKKVEYEEPKTAREKFTGIGRKKVIEAGGFTYTEFVNTVPLTSQMVQTDPNGVPRYDPRTGAAPGGYVQPITDETLGEVAVDKDGNILGYKIYTANGPQWFDASENPLNMDIAFGGSLQRGEDGGYVLVVDPTLGAAATGTDGTKASYDPRQAVNGVKVPGWIIGDPSDPIVSEGSPKAMPSLSLAKMASDQQFRKSVLDTMTDQEITNSFMQESNYIGATDEEKMQMLSEVTTTLRIFRTSKSQSELEQNLTVYRTGDPSAARWGQAQDANARANEPTAPPLPEGPEVDPGAVGAESWEDVIEEKGPLGITGEQGLSQRQVDGLSLGALEWGEDGKIRVASKGKPPEERPELDTSLGEAFTTMMAEAKGKIMSTVNRLQQGPDKVESPRIKPPTVSTPEGQDIGPTPGPSPSPAPSPRIAPVKPPKPEEEEKPEPTPTPTKSKPPTVKEAPPGTKGSPYYGPVAPENVEKPTLDITKPWWT